MHLTSYHLTLSALSQFSALWSLCKIKSRFCIPTNKVQLSSPAFLLSLVCIRPLTHHTSATQIHLFFPQDLCMSHTIFLEHSFLRSSLDWLLVTQVSAQMAPSQWLFLSITTPSTFYCINLFCFLQTPFIIIKSHLVHLRIVHQYPLEWKLWERGSLSTFFTPVSLLAPGTWYVLMDHFSE